MKEAIWTGFLSAALAAVGAYFRQLAIPLAVLLAVMIGDYITGMIRAWMRHELSSRIGVQGIVKKLAYLIAVAVGCVVDWILQGALGQIGVEMAGAYFVGLTLTIWLVLNECISILENLGQIGIPLPGFLMQLIQRLKKTAEEKGDSAAGE